MTDAEADALLRAGNERLRDEAERVRQESAALAEQTERIREQNQILQEVLGRRRRLSARLEAVLTEVEEEERALDGEVRRALALT